MTVANLLSNLQEILRVVRESARAPSVHNIQPGRWHFGSKGELILCADRRVRLPAADASGHDRGVSLGALLEGMSIALGTRGLSLVEHSRPFTPGDPNFEVIAKYQIVEESSASDILAPFVSRRQSHRGIFKKDVSPQPVQERFRGDENATLIVDANDLAQVARLHARATLHFLSEDKYLKELYQWMRFSEKHPRFHLDGLNARAMALDGVEAWVASMALRPGVFSVLRRIGLAEALVAEKAQTLTASGVLLFRARRSDTPLQVGRAFYRTWLKLTQAGMAACPMSSSIDFEVTRRELESLARLAPDQLLVNVLRFGEVPDKPKFKYQPSRIKPEDILV